MSVGSASCSRVAASTHAASMGANSVRLEVVSDSSASSPAVCTALREEQQAARPCGGRGGQLDRESERTHSTGLASLGELPAPS